ncbi:MAG: ribosome-associated translation inhibitor RaiA [Candidatus Brocadiae bacterium]|nr:ribosome-associated translation inhibitor RaiA [Candidatus Brocadiia bacterium]
MRVQITAKHVDMTDEIRDYAEERGEKLGRFYDRITAVDVVLTRDGNDYGAEMICHGTRGQKLMAKLSHEDLFAAIDLVTDKMERQVTKLKEKVRGHHARETPKLSAGVELPSPDQEQYGEDWL